jgi:Na+-transporting NADH:ubiquinone oxidoreductase subunit C
MQQHSVGFTIGFAAAVCAVCSVFVSAAAVGLKERQEENKVLDRREKVLQVAGLVSPDAKPGREEIRRLFEEKVRPRVVDLKTGEYAEDVDPNQYDQHKALSDPAASIPAPPNLAQVARLPNKALVYQVMEDGKMKFLILPVEGKGLWSTLYGYLALSADLDTIAGITFYEHGETPGLGGEIDNPTWKARWPGRKAFGKDGEVEIQVIKGTAGPPAKDPFHVDGLAGATITSRGVTNLLHLWLGENGFGPYLERLRNQEGTS